MKTIPIVFLIQLSLSHVVFFPTDVFSDQNDKRLNDLFSTLQGSNNPTLQKDAESSIWEIWHESGEKEIDALMKEASAAVEAGKLKFAEGLYSIIVDKRPEFSEGWNRRATVRYYQKDFEGSLDDIGRTLVLEPRHFGATWGLGMILGLERKFPAAIAAFERLLVLKPNAAGVKQRIELLKQEMTKISI